MQLLAPRGFAARAAADRERERRRAASAGRREAACRSSPSGRASSKGLELAHDRHHRRRRAPRLAASSAGEQLAAVHDEPVVDREHARVRARDRERRDVLPRVGRAVVALDVRDRLAVLARDRVQPPAVPSRPPSATVIGSTSADATPLVHRRPSGSTRRRCDDDGLAPPPLEPPTPIARPPPSASPASVEPACNLAARGNPAHQPPAMRAQLDDERAPVHRPPSRSAVTGVRRDGALGLAPARTSTSRRAAARPAAPGRSFSGSDQRARRRGRRRSPRRAARARPPRERGAADGATATRGSGSCAARAPARARSRRGRASARAGRSSYTYSVAYVRRSAAHVPRAALRLRRRRGEPEPLTRTTRHGERLIPASASTPPARRSWRLADPPSPRRGLRVRIRAAPCLRRRGGEEAGPSPPTSPSGFA